MMAALGSAHEAASLWGQREAEGAAGLGMEGPAGEPLGPEPGHAPPRRGGQASRTGWRQRRAGLAAGRWIDGGARVARPAELAGHSGGDGELPYAGELASRAGGGGLQVLAPLPELGDQVALAD